MLPFFFRHHRHHHITIIMTNFADSLEWNWMDFFFAPGWKKKWSRERDLTMTGHKRQMDIVCVCMDGAYAFFLLWNFFFIWLKKIQCPLFFPKKIIECVDDQFAKLVALVFFLWNLCVQSLILRIHFFLASAFYMSSPFIFRDYCH